MYEGMHDVAKNQGWHLDPPNPGALHLYSSVTLTKVEEGVPLRLERIGGAEVFTTLATIDPSLPVQFAITNEGLVSNLKHLIGFHDVEVGDAKFDKMFRIVSKDAAGVRRILTPTVRDALTRLCQAANPFGLRGFFVSESGASLTRVTDPVSMTAEQLLADVPVILSVVHALQAAAR